MTWRWAALWAASAAVSVGVGLAAAGAGVYPTDAYTLLILTNFVTWAGADLALAARRGDNT